MRSRGRRGCRRDSAVGVVFSSFGIGLLACTMLPTKLMVVLLGAALVLCGISCGKR